MPGPEDNPADDEWSIVKAEMAKLENDNTALRQSHAELERQLREAEDAIDKGGGTAHWKWLESFPPEFKLPSHISNPGGWIRRKAFEVVAELTRLRSENADLKEKLDESKIDRQTWYGLQAELAAAGKANAELEIKLTTAENRAAAANEHISDIEIMGEVNADVSDMLAKICDEHGLDPKGPSQPRLEAIAKLLAAAGKWRERFTELAGEVRSQTNAYVIKETLAAMEPEIADLPDMATVAASQADIEAGRCRPVSEIIEAVKWRERYERLRDSVGDWAVSSVSGGAERLTGTFTAIESEIAAEAGGETKHDKPDNTG